MNLVNFWSEIKNDKEIKNFFISDQEIYDIANENNTPFEDLNKILCSFEKEMISFELNEKYKDYVVYSNSGINNRNVKSDNPVYVWMYENGSYSAMLSIL